MLDSGLIDVVFIATPMEFHAAQTIQALRRDIHVLCEVRSLKNGRQGCDHRLIAVFPMLFLFCSE